jgi:hypothetical protein
LVVIKVDYYYKRQNYLYKKLQSLNGDWGWGLGIGDWGLGPIPNPQSPIPNPQSPIKFKIFL